MSLVPTIKDNDWTSVRQAIQKLGTIKLGKLSTPEFASITLSDLTASRLIASDGTSKLISTDINSWITGTSNQITVTDDGDGTVTLSTPQDIDTACSFQCGGLTIESSTTPTLTITKTGSGSMSLYNDGSGHYKGETTATGGFVVSGTVVAFRHTADGSNILSIEGNEVNVGKNGGSPIAGVINILDGAGGETTIEAASGELKFTDTVVGTRTLKQLGCPTYKYIKATTQSEGDLHLSDGTYWGVSKALIKYIRIITSSTNWDLYVLQNDNGYAADDANIPKIKIGDSIIGNANLWLDLPYEDEDDSDEIHLYWIDNSGTNTADIYILGYELL